jgi:hypothetical protein
VLLLAQLLCSKILDHNKPTRSLCVDTLQEKGVGVTYKNLRLVSTRLDWEWVGEVHEYVRRKDSRHHEQQDIDGLWFNHDASGGQEGKRFVRDEVILAKVSALGATT